MTRSRRKRILLSYATTAFSKSAAAGVQLLGLPVVAATLGAERFGALLVLAAVGSFCCMPAHGIPSSASFGIARARAVGDEDRMSAELRSAGLLSLSMGAVALLIATGACWLLDPTVLLGAGAAGFAQEARSGMSALALFIAATYFFSWVEGLRSGYEEYHVTNFFTLLGSISALAGIALAWAFAPSIPAFFIATFAAYPLLQGINLLLFLVRRRSALTGAPVTWVVLKGTAQRAFGYSRAQLGLILHLQGSVYLAAQAFGLGAGALVGGVVRLFYIMHNLLLSLLNPILPTLSYAIAAGDHRWVRRTVRRTAAVIMAVLVLLACAIAAFGSLIVEAWLAVEAPREPVLFAALGAMALLYIASQLFYLMLLALGDGQPASRRIFWAGGAGTAGGTVGMQVAGLSGLIIGQVLAMLAIAFVPIAVRLFHRAREEAQPSVVDRSREALNAEAVIGAIED